MLYCDLQIIVGSEPLKDLIRITCNLEKFSGDGNRMTSGLLDQRRSRSDNQACRYLAYEYMNHHEMSYLGPRSW